MTEKSNKSSSGCLICSNRIGLSSRNSIPIFNGISNNGEKSLINTICTVLEEDINEENSHSSLLCKKCYKLFNEFDTLESRLLEIKEEIGINYKATVQKLNEAKQFEDECNDHDYVDSAGVHYSVVDQQFIEEKDIKNFIEQQHIEESLDISSIKEDEEEEHHTMVEYLHEDFREEGVDDPESEMIVEYIENPTELIEDSMPDKNNYILPDKTTIGQVIAVETDKLLQNPTRKNNNRKKRETKKKIPGIEHPQEPIVIKDGSNYTCLLCPSDKEKLTDNSKNIIIHMRDVHEARLYICDVCGLDFRKRNELNSHVDNHVDDEEGDFQCEVCNRIFENLRLFRVHRRSHNPQTKSWECDVCEKRFGSKNLLNEHINVHIGKRPYKCEICGKDFASKYTFRAHVKTHEVRARPFECHQCTKSFLSQQNLTQHERTHLGVKDFICTECGKAFGSSHNLEVHKIVHTGHKPYVCRFGDCGKAFARKAEIRDHERTHTGEKPYQCEHCGSTFSQRSNLQSHKRATHYNDKRYKCDDCGKGFKRRRLLDYHIKAVHTGERPYKCDKCDSTFVYPEHWKKHQRIHTGEKPYSCEVCGKHFNSRDNRNAHRFIHSNKKPYECLICGMGFMRKPMLYAHMEEEDHMNDTIVINQPKMSVPDNPEITSPENVEYLLEEGDSELVEDEQLYELKEHIIIQQDGEHIYERDESLLEMSGEENVQHIIVNEQQMAFEEVMESKPNVDDTTVYNYQDSEENETINDTTTIEYKNILGDTQNHVRLVQISVQGNETKGWVSLVPQET